MKIYNILKSKRGIAMENAILFMVIIFSLCALLTTLTTLGHYQTKIEKTTLIGDIKVDRIGEDYIACLRSDSVTAESIKTKLENVHTDYAFEVNANDANSVFTLKVWHKSDNEENYTDDTVILYVEAEKKDGEVTVHKWRHSLPG